MNSRFEYKYLVPNSLVGKIRADISSFMVLDEYARKRHDGEYTVRSIYYDSPQFSCYQEKVDGVKLRNKYRIRGYNTISDQSIIFLEIKHKNTNCVSKSRAPIFYKDRFEILTSSNIDDFILSFSGNGKEKKDAYKFLYYYRLKNLRPAVLVIYDREAFHGKFDPSLRVTFDKNLRSVIYPNLNQLDNEDSAKSVLNNDFILEIKFYGSLPAWIRALINKYGLIRESLSKYTMSLENYPEFKNPNFARMNMITDREYFYVQ